MIRFVDLFVWFEVEEQGEMNRVKEEEGTKKKKVKLRSILQLSLGPVFF